MYITEKKNFKIGIYIFRNWEFNMFFFIFRLIYSKYCFFCDLVLYIGIQILDTEKVRINFNYNFNVNFNFNVNKTNVPTYLL